LKAGESLDENVFYINDT